MNNRICPTEERLSEYYTGSLKADDKDSIEKHLSECDECRTLLADTHEVLQGINLVEIADNIFRWIIRSRWLIGSLAALLSSFLFPGYFLQFLVMCILAGVKWIIDAKATKTLIMVREAQKHGKSAGRLPSFLDSEKK